MDSDMATALTSKRGPHAFIWSKMDELYKSFE